MSNTTRQTELRQAYVDALFQYRQAELALLKGPSSPLEIQNANDARVIFAAAKRAYFEAFSSEASASSERDRPAETPAEATFTLPKDPSGAAFLIDRELRYLLADGDAFRKAGMVPSDLVGKSALDVLSDEGVANIRRVLDGGEFEQRHAVGERWFVSRGTPVRDQQGVVSSALVISYDVTE